jgi:hypothetical protein
LRNCTNAASSTSPGSREETVGIRTSLASRSAAAAAPVGRTAVATGLTNTTKVMGGTVASCVFALVLAAGAPTLSSGVVGTAGSLSGYIAVWTICGVTALVAAAALLVVPKLAFADRADAVPDAERTPV